jgi:hypothetical protein
MFKPMRGVMIPIDQPVVTAGLDVGLIYRLPGTNLQGAQ